MIKFIKNLESIIIILTTTICLISSLLYLNHRLPREQGIIPRVLNTDERNLLDTLYPIIADKFPSVSCHFIEEVNKLENGYSVLIRYRENIKSISFLGYTEVFFDKNKMIYKFLTDEMETPVK
jgi:hypothetical protein